MLSLSWCVWTRCFYLVSASPSYRFFKAHLEGSFFWNTSLDAGSQPLLSTCYPKFTLTVLSPPFCFSYTLCFNCLLVYVSCRASQSPPNPVLATDNSLKKIKNFPSTCIIGVLLFLVLVTSFFRSKTWLHWYRLMQRGIFKEGGCHMMRL